MLDHADTRTGGSDNGRITFGKGMHEVQGNRARLVFKAVVEKRLSAAGLFGRECQFHAQTLQDVSHILKRGGVELVAKTGNEELGFCHNLLFVWATGESPLHLLAQECFM